MELKRETIDAFDSYIASLEARLSPRFKGESFLWTDSSAASHSQLKQGLIVVQPGQGTGSLSIKNGSIQDWMGAVFIPNVNLNRVLSIVQNYDRHSEIYKPEIAAAKIRSRKNDDFQVYMRVVKSKFLLTDVLNTEHDVHFLSLDPKRVYSRCYSRRIAEVTDAGKPGERELPVGQDRGLLWRLYGYWFFEERDGGVYVECESVTLTRDVPFGMGRILGPIIQNLPAESIRNSLEQTRNALR